MARTLLVSSSSALRVAEADSWVAAQRADSELLLVGGGSNGILDLARRAASARCALFGWNRLSMNRLSLRLAEPSLVGAGVTPATPLALEALWTRVVHDLRTQGKLGRFATVADKPGLPGALARTVEEMRLAGVEPAALDVDLSRAAMAFERALAEAALADRAAVLRAAIAECSRARHPLTQLPLLLLDVEVHHPLEGDLIRALAKLAPDVCATVPFGDDRSVDRLARALEVAPAVRHALADEPLARLQRNLFEAHEPPRRDASDQVTVFSAPGEMRECVEVARLVVEEAARGTPFDHMAVLVRSPSHYRTSIAEALRRAGIPAYFATDARKPDPAGRAFLALLACAEESLSARRFAEYLSLGEVPDATAEGGPPSAPASGERWTAADRQDGEGDLAAPDPEAEPDVDDPEAPVVAGTLRAPRRWERLLVDAAVIGGRDRWRRRMEGLEAQLAAQLEDPTVSEAALVGVSRTLAELRALRQYALPLLDVLAAFPHAAPWGEWLDQLSALASRALRHPARVLGLLSELLPMSAVGPVGLAEVRRILAPRLIELATPPPSRRFGRLFVGSAHAARGMTFEVVFTPGLAERIFPQKVHGDPLCTDVDRVGLSSELECDADRARAERLHLRLAVGAASRRIALSYPRLDSREGRPRVPSFYGLEALRATEGRLLRYEELRHRAEVAVDARIGWPAPSDPSRAIDFAERDLAILEPLFRAGAPPMQGAAQYLVEVNPFLARALRAHYMRWHARWHPMDGLVRLSAEGLRALETHQLNARAFSPTALQHYSACPYRFFLSAIMRLRPRQDPKPIEELDPLQRGTLVHEVLYGVMSTLRDRGALPITAAGLDAALAYVDTHLDTVSARYRDLWAPAIDRVWNDGINHIRADLREAVRQMARSSAEWTPWKFELAFGLSGSHSRELQDPESRRDPVALDVGLSLRGSIDLVERSASGALRATDYKTGKASARSGTRVGGGKTLQPVLYALTLEKMFPGSAVAGGRLSYCTLKGGFSEVSVPLDQPSRDAAHEAIGIVSQALQAGFLPAAPEEKACAYCDLNDVCGLDEETRTARKPKKDLKPLARLREME